MAVSNLSPYQQALQSVVGTGKGAGAKLTPEILGRVADQIFGPFPIPPGSQIVFQGPDRAEWVDAEGFRHTATRSLDGRDPSAGQIKEQTDRPPILPPAQGQNDLLSQLSGGVNTVTQQLLSNLAAQAKGERVSALDPGINADLDAARAIAARLQQPTGLAALDPETQAALQAITQNTMAQLKQQFERDQANQLAALFGNRIQSSSIATNALGQLLQNQGLVTSQALSDAATREIGTRQFLTDTNRANLATALSGLLGTAGTGIEGFRATTGASQAQFNSLSDLLQNLTGQQTQRDIATGGLNLDFAKLLESQRQANQGFQLDQQEADRRLAESRSLLPKILATIQTLGQTAQGVGTGLVGFGVGGKK